MKSNEFAFSCKMQNAKKNKIKKTSDMFKIDFNIMERNKLYNWRIINTYGLFILEIKWFNNYFLFTHYFRDRVTPVANRNLHKLIPTTIYTWTVWTVILVVKIICITYKNRYNIMLDSVSGDIVVKHFSWLCHIL